jgi:uncharacterized membrane protein YqjE
MATQRNSSDGGAGGGDRPVGELLQQLSTQTQTLVRDEMELARAELTEKGKTVGLGAGMFGGAGLFGLFAFGALTAAIILVLAEGMAAWIAALIVAVVYGAVAGVLALTGKKKVEQGTPPVPEEAVESTRADVQRAKQGVQTGRDRGE